MSSQTQAAPTEASTGETGGRVYVLVVLLLVYVLNFVDRQIPAILAESIKRDLRLSDSDLGFMFGTAFAVFYAVLGVPLARLADVWNRRGLICAGLSAWSVMTAASAFAPGFLSLTLCRFGVGAGEASATPAAYSMLYDYFPPRIRTTVLSIYSAGNFIGGGLGIFLGGLILKAWTQAFPDPALAPWGLKGWQAAFLAVGLPGLVMAVWVATLKEPQRGAGDGLVTPPHPTPGREAFAVLLSVLPLTSLWMLKASGASGRALVFNLGAAVMLAVAAVGLIALTRNTQQWAALGIALYAAISWGQALAVRDPVCFRMIFGSSTLLWTVAAGAAANFLIGVLGLWSAPYYHRQFGLSATEVAPVLALASGLMGLCGVVAGGALADYLCLRTPKGKLLVFALSLVGAIAGCLFLLTAATATTAYVGSFALMLFFAMGLGPSVSTLNDLVLPRMRATASAFGFMVTLLFAGAFGPYLIGAMSDHLVASGLTAGDALRTAILGSLVVPAAGLGCLIAAMRSMDRQPVDLIARARRLGEPLITSESP